MLDTPRSNRLHISFFGKRNAGKSSLVNAITNQSISLVSNIPGTTTDPVFKSMELLPLGPVVIVDTAGLDDEGSLGKLRVKKSIEVLDKTDLAVLVISSEDILNKNFDLSREYNWISQLKKRNIPILGAISKIDLYKDFDSIFLDKKIKNLDIPFIKISSKNEKSIDLLKEAIVEHSPSDFEKSTIISDILKKKSLVLLVAPQDIQAPKGRLILPQVQTIRDLLDNDAIVLTVKDSELKDSLKLLNKNPDLVITDSQKFKEVNEILSKDILLTSFSIIMARYKGDLDILIEGAKAIDFLKPDDKVLIAEACTHHALKGDIAREKLPKLLNKKIGGNLNFTNISGVDYPKNLNEYKLIIQCGSCMFTRNQLMNRLYKAKNSNVPVTNFGIAIAHLNGILKRTTEMFVK